MLQPESRGQRSYYEAFARRRNLTPNVLAKERVLTDRGAYLNFLEVQLERVSAACLATQALSQDLKGVTAQASSAEDKVREVKSCQSSLLQADLEFDRANLKRNGCNRTYDIRGEKFLDREVARRTEQHRFAP